MPSPSPASGVRIVDYEPRHRDAFRALNIAWITHYFEIEEADRRQLEHPDVHILASGGRIFIAELGDDVVGSSALLRDTDGSLWLAKMAVAPEMRRHGTGRALAIAAIDAARALGAPRIALLSNTVLEPAIRLYRSLGFVEAPLPPQTGHVRANIHMVLDLTSEPR